MAPPLSLPADRLANRRELLKQVDQLQQSAEVEANSRAKTVDVFRQQAFDLMISPAAKQAFDIHAEPDKLRDAYGRAHAGPVVPDGPPAGRGGRAVRDDRPQQLGHARRQLRAR